MTLLTISLKGGQMAKCPSCKREQSDPIQDYFATRHIGSSTGLVDRCESCGVKLRFLCQEQGEYEIQVA